MRACEPAPDRRLRRLERSGNLDVTYTVHSARDRRHPTQSRQRGRDRLLPRSSRRTPARCRPRPTAARIQIKIGTDAYRTVLRPLRVLRQPGHPPARRPGREQAPVWLSYVTLLRERRRARWGGGGEVQREKKVPIGHRDDTTLPLQRDRPVRRRAPDCTVTALAGKWQDSKGNLGTAGGAYLAVEVPVAHIATAGRRPVDRGARGHAPATSTSSPRRRATAR